MIEWVIWNLRGLSYMEEVGVIYVGIIYRGVLFIKVEILRYCESICGIFRVFV